MMEPKISVITVVFNSRDLLQGTIHSVRDQTLEDLEYVVVDGKSTDGTKELITANLDVIDVWISEPDDGIFDAMNKGLQLASGEFILFLNAGDHLHRPDVLVEVFQKVDDSIDIAYGQTLMVDADRNATGLRSDVTPHLLPQNLAWTDLRFGLCVSHQSFIVRRSIAGNYVENNISADTDWVIECLKKSRQSINVGIIISEFLIGGFSKQHRLRSWIDRYKMLRKHFGFLPNLFNHLQITVRAIKHALRCSGAENC
ncbi:MAG: glycosyltransferase [Saprospiraceae bacterium]|nr:glycosyltransferase [Saprospiraceae bacterium]